MLNRNTLPKDIQDRLDEILNKDISDLKEEEFCFLSARRDYLKGSEIGEFLEQIKPEVKKTTKKGRK